MFALIVHFQRQEKTLLHAVSTMSNTWAEEKSHDHWCFKTTTHILIKACQSSMKIKNTHFSVREKKISLDYYVSFGRWCIWFWIVISILYVNIFLVHSSQKAPPSDRNLRGPKRCSRTCTIWPFHLQSCWGSGTDWLRHLLLGNMFSISEL